MNVMVEVAAGLAVRSGIKAVEMPRTSFSGDGEREAGIVRRVP